MDQNNQEPPASHHVVVSIRAKLEPVVSRILESHGLDQTTSLLEMWKRFQNQILNSNFDSAMQLVPEISNKIREIESESNTDGIKRSEELLTIALQNWVAARQNLHNEMEKLQQAIMAVCQQIGMENMDEQTQQLFSYLEVFDDELERVLQSIIDIQSQNVKKQRCVVAKSIVQRLREELNSPFFVDVDDDNGFVSVNIRSLALEALSKIDAALSQFEVSPSR